MVPVDWPRYPLVSALDEARRWLQFTANIGRAPNTVEAYGRGLNDYLCFCSKADIEPLLAGPDTIAAWIGDLRARPNPQVRNVVYLASGTGLSSSTIAQRVVAVRSFYQHLVEDGIRDRNPVRRGERGHGRSRRASRGLIRHVRSAPWIPNDELWQRILTAAQWLQPRDRLMFSLAYDGALRREELVSLDVDDFEPAYSLIHVRAETTKSMRAREVAYGQTSGVLLGAYLDIRRTVAGRRRGPLFLSGSPRNRGSGIGPWTWSKTMQHLARRAGVLQLSAHTLRHLRLTDLARAGWTIDQIAQYAGHASVETTLAYIHLSGRDLAERFHRANNSVLAAREALLVSLARSP